MSGSRTKQQKAAMLEALEQSLGVVTTACQKVGISRKKHYQWLQSDQEYREQVEELENVSLDFAESQLFKQIREGSTSATIFYLKTRGKKRGYVEKQEVEQVGNTDNIQIEIVEPSNES